MTREKEGAAIRQDRRSGKKLAMRQRPRPSVAEKRANDRAALSLMKFAACVAVGVAFLFSLMWLAAAY